MVCSIDSIRFKSACSSSCAAVCAEVEASFAFSVAKSAFLLAVIAEFEALVAAVSACCTFSLRLL